MKKCELMLEMLNLDYWLLNPTWPKMGKNEASRIGKKSRLPSKSDDPEDRGAFDKGHGLELQ